MPYLAQTVATATPCWPAPVSAMMRVLAHAAGEQDLAKAIVDLVAAGVVQLVALEIDLRATEMLAQPLRVIERRRPAAIVAQQTGQLLLKLGVGLCSLIGFLQLENKRHERFGDETASEVSEVAALIRARREMCLAAVARWMYRCSPLPADLRRMRYYAIIGPWRPEETREFARDP